MLRAFFLPILLIFAVQLTAQSNLFIDTSIPPDQMVEDFFNTSQVTISNVSFTGAPPAMGYFEAANTDLDLLAGILLTTGCVAEVPMPADSLNNGGCANNLPGDSDLNTLITTITRDASVLEFDLTAATTDTLCIIYRFGSEEYPEFGCSSFNDLFAFFVSGPGYNGLYNCATIPDTNLAVSINNLHGAPDSLAMWGVGCPEPAFEQYYVPYALLDGQHAMYDGMTTTLPAKFAVQAGETYHVKIAIADAQDWSYDSGVFLSINSFGGDSLLAPVAAFTSTSPSALTAEVANHSRYATTWQWDFGDGTPPVYQRNPAPHGYAVAGTYHVRLVVQNWCCTDTAYQYVTVGSTTVHEPAAERFQIGPNPVHDLLTVQPADAGTPYSLEVFDLTGRLVFRRTLNVGTQTLSVSGWHSGLYFVQCRQDGQYVRKRVRLF